jgi:hypothetical protein
VTERDSMDGLRKCEAIFESYWIDGELIWFDDEKQEDESHLKLMFEIFTSNISTVKIKSFYFSKSSGRYTVFLKGNADQKSN